jgi:PERQ amino acid-rich with GYF domain-containing protein
MTESIKFGPEWLRNSVANVSSYSGPNSSSSAPATDSNTLIARPVLSDHRYGREEMLSLCDKSTRLPEVLTRFRRLFVHDWQTPLALQPNTDDERSLGASTTWGPSHIRPLIPGSGMGRGGAGIIRGGSIERGRGRGRGLYHGSAGYTRSTSMYDEEGRRNLWLDRNGTETTEWSGAGSTVSPRKEYSRGTSGMENWRKGTRDESGGAGGDVDWRSSNNGSAPVREKWGNL